jgi:S-adenosylmethionine/arginine decarboxylase-like enzyme
VDFFTCGGKVRTDLALDLLRGVFKAKEVEELVVARGPLQILREGTLPARGALVTE